MKVLLGGDFNPSSTRVHAWAFNLFPYDIESNLAKRLSLKPEDATLYRSAVYLFKEWTNMYMNNRQLSDENRYIFER